MSDEKYEVVYWRGVRLDRKTIAPLEWVEKQSGITIQLAQGSYNGGAVAASGSTHAGGGAVDVRCVYLSLRDKVRLLRWLKRAGFAAWRRRAVSGLWGEHIHAIQIGNDKASSSAQWQVNEYLARRTGLTSGGADWTYRPKPPVRWSYEDGKPVPL